MSIPDTTIVIPQRGQGHLTVACLMTLRRYESVTWPVIVVDDGSPDDAAELVRSAQIENCDVIEQSPRGVTAAWNTGLQRIETEFAVLLNNDVEIEGPFVERLVEPLRTRRAMIAGVEWHTEPLVSRAIVPDRRVLAGWCFAFRTELWHRLGRFDESLALYFSDTYFQCRVITSSHATQSPPLATAGPLPLQHLNHQTARLNPRRIAAWHADAVRFVRKWEIPIR